MMPRSLSAIFGTRPPARLVIVTGTQRGADGTSAAEVAAATFNRSAAALPMRPVTPEGVSAGESAGAIGDTGALRVTGFPPREPPDASLGPG
jgi:hypothetical protein